MELKHHTLPRMMILRRTLISPVTISLQFFSSLNQGSKPLPEKTLSETALRTDSTGEKARNQGGAEKGAKLSLGGRPGFPQDLFSKEDTLVLPDPGPRGPVCSSLSPPPREEITPRGRRGKGTGLRANARCRMAKSTSRPLCVRPADRHGHLSPRHSR